MNHAIIIGTVFPEPNSTAAGTRMLQLIKLLQDHHYQITFFSTANPSDFSFDLATLNVQMKHTLLNDASFDKDIQNINPQLVIFDRFTIEEQFGWRVSKACPDAITILDTEDLHFLRKARENAYKQRRELIPTDLISEVFKRELASIHRCDLSLIISEYEMNLLTSQFKINPDILFYLPLFSENSSSKLPFAERKHFISIGNFLHEPNWQTVLKLKELWQSIHKALPQAELHIYGAYPPPKALQLHNEREKFLIKGRAESVEEVFSKARVLLAPIPFGAGIKGKLLDAMQYGLPSVTSTIGAEGMHNQLNWNGYIEDEMPNFTEKAILLYSDENLWNTAQSKGFSIIKKRFLKDNFSKSFSEKIYHLRNQLPAHRLNNFWGQILQHHTLQSSKYMGKWIEEKNKK
ncbi:glycosyltransferase family 4 protein [Bergeyella porcorum]|uniref:glycosyltransferase family 4 protein n=1 Tax=Bergeyella porcorum TaxID=1735111 RepID=UPI0035EBA54A